MDVAQSSDIPVSESGASLFQAVFDLKSEGADWPPVLIERLWGEKTGKLELRVVNTPFFVRGIAFGDLISVRPDHERRELVFDGLKSESGHSAVLVVFRRHSKRGEVERKLRESGCDIGTLSTFENLISISIPPVVDYGELRGWLLEQAAAEDIDLQENAISKIHRRQLPEFP
ncbi:DUF4265 domain-containing protein [Lentzea sp. NPDC051213]|uniref:DUF4265 domain-containing protein n=1 Tax=Lentzea sp. NPDC051213 TaxID=3364126 RepID=UPI0037B27670